MVAIPLVVALVVALLAGAVVVARARRAAARYAERQVEELVEAAARREGEQVAVTGKLVIASEPCDASDLSWTQLSKEERSRKLAATTHTLAQGALSPIPRGEGRSRRAEGLLVESDDESWELVGPLAVEAGSLHQVRGAAGGQAAVTMALFDGDWVTACGARGAPAAASDEAGYRSSAVQQRLVPAAEGETLELAHAGGPALSFPSAKLWRHPGVWTTALVALLLALIWSYDLARDHATTLSACPCKQAGLCSAVLRSDNVVPALVWGNPFVCGATRDADCAHTTVCKRFGRCSAVDSECRVAKDADCAHTTVCRQDGRCSAVDGECRVAKDADCAHTTVCKHFGKCSAVDGECVAEDADCAPRAECKHFGRCSAVDGECRIGKDADCALTTECKEFGHCSAVDGACRVAKDADCSGTRGCKKRGKCSAVDGECRADKDADCAPTEGCKKRGWCSAGDGYCRVGNDADCAASEVCREHGLCSAVDGECRRQRR